MRSKPHRCLLPALIAALLTFAAGPSIADNSDDTALLDYASGLHFAAPPNADVFRKLLARTEHQLERNPVPDEGCAQTLGARRFAGLLNDLASARQSLGDIQGAIDAHSKALACSPRAVYLHADLASGLMNAGRLAEARQAALNGLAIDSQDDSIATILGQLDFIEEKWTEAIAHTRTAARNTPDAEHSAYRQLHLWLAQRRYGISRPELIDRDFPDDWPRPILEALQGALTEQELVDEVKEEPDAARQREILCEALYYIGQKRLASGDTQTAERYLSAATEVNVPYFIEHHMALAELQKLRR